MDSEDSQADMFFSQVGKKSRKEKEKYISSSCPAKTVYEYSFVILFNWSMGCERPFKIYNLQAFDENEIKESWIKFQMKNKTRMKKLTGLAEVPDKAVSLFAKIERCIDTKYPYPWVCFFNLFIFICGRYTI